MKNLLEHILKETETFLTNWTERMKSAGYLEHTTAKREDCILSLHGIIIPVRTYINQGLAPDFTAVLSNGRNVAEFLLKSAHRHYERGIGEESFFGCFKTLLHAVEDIILEQDADPAEKLLNYIELRRILDAMETITVADWHSRNAAETATILQNKNRELTLLKNKFENILESASDLFITVNGEGQILEMNASAGKRFGERTEGLNVLDVFRPGCSFAEFLDRYPFDKTHEITTPDGSSIYSLVIIPLKKVSLASEGYVIVLNDITYIADQRMRLEQEVTKRTQELAESEKLFRSLFSSAGEGIILADSSLKIVQANLKAAEIFGLPEKEIEGKSCVRFIHPGSIDAMRSAMLMPEGEIWNGEFSGVTAQGDSFPASITLNRFRLDSGDFFHIIIRNITRQKAMEEHLKEEKTKAEEMNVTLRNVLKTIDREKEELMLGISQKVVTNIIPSVQKLAAETSPEIRTMYAGIIRDLLAGLTEGTGTLNAANMAKLTKAEIQICQLIQSGSDSKEIAESMNISFDTVQTHRKNIRRKLGLSGRDVSLFTYLNNR
ncbi:PAS domain S-box protein [Geovibrio ferrireducens]|uniref:PAS domain S-box protein n=1 Tax=Geovibrio ferrireducens TaxID=46201 RepID=UPI002247694D|nr:PAS domain S-box protein [Geovibrio ferrireducens]